MTDEEKCDCVQRLDKVRMDLESGKDVSFVCYVFRGDPMDYEPIIHRPTTEMLYLVGFDAQRLANKKADLDEAEAKK